MKKIVKQLLKDAGFEIVRIQNNENKLNEGLIDLTVEHELPIDTRKILNVLHYTKTSGTSYSAQQYFSGYHTVTIDGRVFPGQRDTAARLSGLNYDFKDKVVLDIGCNQGGMLLAIAERVKYGIGIDYDSRMINAATRLSSSKQRNNLSYYVFDLQTENLNLIKNFIPGEDQVVDIVFLLSVCMWINNWNEVIDFASEISSYMLFESNGTDEQQKEQEDYLRRKYAEIEKVRDSSPDDPNQKARRLYLCSLPVR